MIKYLLDTNIVIYTIKNKPEQVRERFNAHDGQMAISSITLMELLYGAEKSTNPERNLKVVESFASRLAAGARNPVFGPMKRLRLKPRCGRKYHFESSLKLPRAAKTRTCPTRRISSGETRAPERKPMK